MIAKLTLVLLALLSNLDAAAATMPTSFGEQVAVAEPVANVQVELLPDLEGADALAATIRDRLTAAGLGHPVLVEIVPGEPELPVSYRVVVGPFFAFEDAERARTELEGVGVHGFVREFEPLIGC